MANAQTYKLEKIGHTVEAITVIPRCVSLPGAEKPPKSHFKPPNILHDIGISGS